MLIPKLFPNLREAKGSFLIHQVIKFSQSAVSRNNLTAFKVICKLLELRCNLSRIYLVLLSFVVVGLTPSQVPYRFFWESFKVKFYFDNNRAAILMLVSMVHIIYEVWHKPPLTTLTSAWVQKESFRKFLGSQMILGLLGVTHLISFLTIHIKIIYKLSDQI